MTLEEREQIRRQRKQEFIRALAEYLVGNQAEMSVWLGMGKEFAQAWAELRSTTPLAGYPSVDDAEIILTEFLT